MTKKKSGAAEAAEVLALIDRGQAEDRRLELFASAALAGIVAGGRIGPAADMAAAAYDVAEAMVAERTKRGAK